MDGYQKRDIDIIDYELYKNFGIGPLLRGPKPDVDIEKDEFIVCIGAAQTYGCYVEKPFPKQLSEKYGLPVINLGVAGAGPQFYHKRQKFIDLINKAKLVIVQVMSARSVSNSIYESVRDGEMLKNRHTGEMKGAEIAWKEIIKNVELDTLNLVEENKRTWLEHYKILSEKIKAPTILFYFSEREADYDISTDSVYGLFGKFPQLVNRAMIDKIRYYFDDYVECISDIGMPQKLIDKKTGLPTKIKMRNDLGGQYKKYNNYYPSPEMHELAAKQLKSIESKINTKSIKKIIFHIHLFKNAGTSLDATFQENFKDEWVTKEFHGRNEKRVNEIKQWILDNPKAKCFSSHTAIFPLPKIPGIEIFPVIFVRNPIDRIASAYSFESKVNAKGWEEVLAHNTSFKGYVDVRLAMENDYQCKNFHARRFATLFDGGHGDIATGAMKALGCIPFIGLVEKYNDSLSELQSLLRARGFKDIELKFKTENISHGVKKNLDQKLIDIKEQLGNKLFSQLIDANKIDLDIWNNIVERYN